MNVQIKIVYIFYGDKSAVIGEGYVSYGWQFPDEKASVLVGNARDKINIFGLIDRNNTCHFATSEKNINANFVIEKLEKLSFSIKKNVDCFR